MRSFNFTAHTFTPEVHAYRPLLCDGIGLLVAMDEMVSETAAERMSVVREGRPMRFMAALALQGFMEIDLDGALICPDTQVRRIRG